jgi:hypothetical protein
MKFREHLSQIVSQLEPEYRVPVADALRMSDGTPVSFEQELQAQTWEHPGLPVEQILQQVMVDQ